MTRLAVTRPAATLGGYAVAGGAICPECHAIAGVHCVTSSGIDAHGAHGVRFDQAWLNRLCEGAPL